MAEPPQTPRSGIRLATIASVPVYLGWSWLVLAALVVLLVGQTLAEDLGAAGYLLGAAYAVGLLVCVLAHEGAHAVAARAHGHEVLRVVADLWGGHTAFDATRGTPRSGAIIALAGPGANLLLAALGVIVARLLDPSGIPGAMIGAFTLVNLLLGVFNLMPGLPLDGGQLVESLVWGVTGDQGLGRIVAGWSGRVLVVIVVLVALAVTYGGGVTAVTLIWTAMIGAFLWSGASGAIASGQAMRALAKVDVGALLEPAVAIGVDEPLSRLLQARALPVVVDAAGHPVGLIDHDAVRAVPADRVETTAVAAVTSHLPTGWSTEVGGPTPTLDLVRAFQTSGSGVVAVTDAGRLRGVVRAERLNAALRGR